MIPIGPSVTTTIKVALLCPLGYVLRHLLFLFVIDPIRSPLRNLPGPPAKGWFTSHLTGLMSPSVSPATHDAYMKEHGKSFRVKGFGYFDDRLLTLDPRAISHVLNNNQDYEKPWQSRRLISGLIGNGLLASEGLHHRKQRKVMNPAFSITNIRALTPIFVSKAFELRDRWMELVTTGAPGPLDVAHWISRATFDVIGLTGFDYKFNAIQNEDNEVYLAYKEMFDLSVNQRGQTPRALASIFFPWLDRILPNEATRTVEKSHGIIYGVGNKLVQDKKREFLEGKAEAAGSKDLLSLLIKSNLSDVPVEQQITDKDIMDQINTFFFAGSDTTSLALSWTLLMLAQHPDLQTRLRDEIITFTQENSEDLNGVDFSAIDRLSFLDKVAKESLRLVPPVHSSLRVAMQDDIIPTTFPVKMRNGEIKHEIQVQKGQFIHVAMEGFNLDKSVWGDDAWEFNPDRWDHLPEAVRSQPGLWANIMSFSMGPRGCIGFRFSIVEMKVFLYALLPAFVFQTVPDKVVFKLNVVLTRPYVRGAFSQGSQLPLIVTPYKTSQDLL